MDMTGEYRIPAPRQRVWEALNDPDVLRQAIPGCQSLEKKSDTEFAARVRAKVGPVNATFNGQVTLDDLNPPESYTIRGEGSGGVAGFAKGGAEVHLSPDGPDTTILRYRAKADVGGKLAQIGSRLIQGTAKKMADEFFGKFSAIVSGGEVAAGETRPVGAPPPTGPEPAPAPPPVTAPSPAGTAKATGAGDETPTAPPEAAPPRPAVGEEATAPPPAAAAPAPEGERREARPAEAAAAAASVRAPAPQPRPEARGPSEAEPRGTPRGFANNPFVWIGAIVLVILLLFLILS